MNSPRMLRPGALLVTALAMAAIAAGCGDDSSRAPSTSSTSTTPVVGGTATQGGVVTGVATCDDASIAKAVAGSANANHMKATLAPGSLRCADGWAVADADVNAGDASATVTYVFEAEGQFWIPQDREKVCPKPSPVPAKLYAAACDSN